MGPRGGDSGWGCYRNGASVRESDDEGKMYRCGWIDWADWAGGMRVDFFFFFFCVREMRVFRERIFFCSCIFRFSRVDGMIDWPA